MNKTKIVGLLFVTSCFISLGAFAAEKNNEAFRKPAGTKAGAFMCMTGYIGEISDDGRAENLNEAIAKNCNTSLPFSFSTANLDKAKGLICCTGK